MGLREHLEEQIAEDLRLLKELEDTLRTERDPRLKLKWKEDIKEIKQRVCEYEEELRSLSVSSVQPEPVTPPLSRPEPDEVKLRSERGIDYTKLRNLLAAGEWKEADLETSQVMCQAAGREREDWLDIEDIDKFPCEDLRTINQLWLHYSKGKFGFSVQKEIYESLRGTARIENPIRVWSQFAERVGWWRKESGWGWLWWRGFRWSSYEDTEVVKAPKGHLPRYWCLRKYYYKDYNMDEFASDFRYEAYYGGYVLFSLVSRRDL